MTEAIDFARSFLWWRTDALEKPALTQTSKPPFTLNNARVPLDCLCRIEDKVSDAVQFFALGASCKTERVGVDADIWIEPNADFIPVMSGTRFMALKTYHRAGIELPLEPPSLGYQSERQEVAIAEAFSSARFYVHYAEGRLLENAKERVEAVLDNEILVAKVQLERVGKKIRLLIEGEGEDLEVAEVANVIRILLFLCPGLLPFNNGLDGFLALLVRCQH